MFLGNCRAPSGNHRLPSGSMTFLIIPKRFCVFTLRTAKIIDAECAASACTVQAPYYKHVSFLCLFGAVYLAVLLLIDFCLKWLPEECAEVLSHIAKCKKAMVCSLMEKNNSIKC